MENRIHDAGSIRVGDIAEVIEKIAPTGLQESWDNSGLLIGYEDSCVKRILTCLEVDHEVLREAKEENADMIISHHPLIFGGVSSLCTGNYKERLIMNLVSSGISVYSCHTPFDKVKGGNNDIIAGKLGLTSVRNLRGEDVASASRMIEKADEADIGRTGSFRNPVSFRQVLDIVSSELELSLRQIKAVGSLDLDISKVGICTGAGADLMEMAAASGCELFITGDVKYHEAQTARELGICLIDAGHYGTEKFFGAAMQEKLTKQLGDKVEVIASKVNLDPFQIL
ncbi:MAG: Nif3-like dinuclear metal center hexameric protein [Lentihominibacter sp.]